MLKSKMLLATMKDAPKDAEIISHQLLLKGGYVRQNAAGIYTYLTPGLLVLDKVREIVKKEMIASGAYEILMPAMQPGTLWEETGRIADYGPELMQMKDRHERTFILGPTHEELITDIVRNEIKSYKQLPFAMFQIQTKYRDEMRPRSGLLRGREFLMKDCYSFHAEEESLNEFYEVMVTAYQNIFDACGIKIARVEADSGQIGGSESAEWIAICEVGEDTIVHNADLTFAANVETTDLRAGDLDKDGNELFESKGIELGHIFKLGTRYSSAMNAKVLNNENKLIDIIMGCYGIGVSRMIMGIIEQRFDHENNKMVWPASVSPFPVILTFASAKDEMQVAKANEIYNELKNAGVEVLFDDTAAGFGSKMKDADLLGPIYKIVVGKKVSENVVEFTNNLTNEKTDIAISEIVANINL